MKRDSKSTGESSKIIAFKVNPFSVMRFSKLQSSRAASRENSNHFRLIYCTLYCRNVLFSYETVLRPNDDVWLVFCNA